MAATDFDYIATRNEIIEGAFRIVGALEIGQSLTTDQLDQGVKALQLLIKSWSNKHLFLWSYNIDEFDTVAATETYDSTLDQAILGIDKAWAVDSNEDIPLKVISWSQYQDIFSKETDTGRPSHIAFKSTPSPSVVLWPSPDDVYTIKMLSVFPLEDFDTAASTGDVQARFQRALKYGLAEDLFDEYPGPMNTRQYVKLKAAELFSEASIAEVPNQTTNEVASLFSKRG